MCPEEDRKAGRCVTEDGRDTDAQHCVLLGASVVINGLLDATTIVGLGAGIRATGAALRGGATVLGAYFGASASAVAADLTLAGLFTAGRVRAAVAEGMLELSSVGGVAIVAGGRAAELSALEGMALEGDPLGSLKELGKDLLIPGRATVRSIDRFASECLPPE